MSAHDQLNDLAAFAAEQGRVLFTTWHSQYNAAVAHARDLLARQTVKRMAITWKEDVRRWHPGQQWIWEPGGLGVFDPGIYALSIVTEIMPDPIHLTSAELYFPENCQTPIAADLVFAHRGGAKVTAELDWRHEGEQTWTIAAETDGGTLVLADGGARLSIDGFEQAAADADGNPLLGEYPRLYAKMAALVRSGGIDMDMAPMTHVADAFLLGRRIAVEPFHE